MNFAQAKKFLSTSFRATIETGEPIVPFLWGPPGVGKSACVELVAKEQCSRLNLKHLLKLGDFIPSGMSPKDCFGFIDLRLSQYDAVEVGGFPGHDKERDVMTRVLGEWFPHTGRNDLPDYGILFLDEWTSALPSTQAASYQLASDRRLAGKALKPGWIVVGAGNRMGDGGVVYKQPLPLGNRLFHINFESSFDCFMDHALDTGFLPWITSFLNFRQDLLNTFESHVKNKLLGNAFATERTWDRVNAVCSVVDETDNDNEQVRGFLMGFLGEAVTVEAMAFRSTWQSLPDIDDIIDNPRTSQLPDKPDVSYAVCGALAARATPENFANICAYLERMKPAFATLCVQDAVKRNKSVAHTPAFSAFAARFIQAC